MGLFSKKNSERKQHLTIEPVETHLDQQWFQRYAQSLFDQTGHDRSDQENVVGLWRKIFVVLDVTAKSLMEQTNAPWAYTQFHAYMNLDEATPWGATALIAGWDQTAIPAVEEQLVKFSGMLIHSAPVVGNFHHEWA